jgi:hypothetical protein
LYEYTSRKGFSFSATNGLTSNLKKKPGAPGYQYKARAIGNVARAFAAVINAGWLNGGTLVPVPPSKAKGHAEYDDRMRQVCRQIRTTPPLDVRELVVQRSSLTAAHESQDRPTIEDLLREFQIDESLTNPTPRWIGIFDAAGTHFVATKTIIGHRFPNVRIQGFFIARRVFLNPFEDVPVE